MGSIDGAGEIIGIPLQYELYKIIEKMGYAYTVTTLIFLRNFKKHKKRCNCQPKKM